MIKCKDCKYMKEFNGRTNQYCCSIERPLKCVNINKPKVCTHFQNVDIARGGLK